MRFHKMMRELLDKHGKKFDMEEYHREQLAMMQKKLWRHLDYGRY